jgi:DNA processing protein
MDSYPIQNLTLNFLLNELHRPPKFLYARGDISLLENNNLHFLTIIGTRRITEYGKQVCREIIKGLQGYPFVIISGLALGTDTLVHQLCIEYRIPTIAVVGSGLDESVLYPRSNSNLALSILNQGGSIVSPFTNNFKATPWSFPMRNNIMAGMAHAVVVIEAENKSGSRITARLATEFNREVFSVPGSIFNQLSDGTNQLLKEGATPLLSPQDILDFFGYEKNEQIGINLEKLSLLEQEIYKILDSGKSRDEISELLPETDFTDILISLSSLEIAGYIFEGSGKFQRR